MALPCLLSKHRTRSSKNTPSTTFNALECRANHWTLVSVVGHACKIPTCGTELYLYSKTWENTLVRHPWMTLSWKTLGSWMTLAWHSCETALRNSHVKQIRATHLWNTSVWHVQTTCKALLQDTLVKLPFPFVYFFLLPFSFPTLSMPSLSLLLLYSVFLFSFHSFWPTGKRGSQIFQRRENGDLFSGVPGQEWLTKYSGTFFPSPNWIKNLKAPFLFSHKLTSTAPILHWLCSLTFSSGPLVYDEPN